MSASLVGSEMCIRDRPFASRSAPRPRPGGLSVRVCPGRAHRASVWPGPCAGRPARSSCPGRWCRGRR
eukprot:1314757-Alexandrium_andersonii.AAC.1